MFKANYSRVSPSVAICGKPCIFSSPPSPAPVSRAPDDCLVYRARCPHRLGDWLRDTSLHKLSRSVIIVCTLGLALLYTLSLGSPLPRWEKPKPQGEAPGLGPRPAPSPEPGPAGQPEDWTLLGVYLPGPVKPCLTRRWALPGQLCSDRGIVSP